MNAKKWIPWNWFKMEEENAGSEVPVRHVPAADLTPVINDTIAQFHR
jgi:HSP20 family protein